MRNTVRSDNLRRALGMLMAGAVLASPAYADDQTRDASVTSCNQYTGTERTSCEERLEDRSTNMSAAENDAADRGSDANDANDASSTARDRATNRTRVSRADANNEEDDSEYWDSTREPEPGVVKGADMHTVPIPDPEDRRDDPNSELSDPYQVAPGTETGRDEERE